MIATATTSGPEEQSAWERDLSAALFPTRCEAEIQPAAAPGGRQWANDVRRWPLGDIITLVELHLLPQRWRRTAVHVRDGGGHLACTLTVLEGRLRLRQDGRQLVLDDHATSVVDGARPFVLDVEEQSSVICMLIERGRFARRCAPLGEAAAMPPTNSATANPVAAFVSRLPAALDHPALTGLEAQRLASRSLDLMQLVFTPSSRTTNPREEHLTAAKTFIDDHLKDPDLSPRAVAAGTAISIRYLHELFRSTGETVRQRIIRRRVERARFELGDPRWASASISAIAADNGFKTAAHFSRCFADLYGQTPTEARSHEQAARLEAELKAPGA